MGSVSPQVFLPRPKVTSALVRIIRREKPAVEVDPTKLFELVRTAFGQRRKMLRRSLAGTVTEAQFAAAGVASDARPEELDVQDWGRLCQAMS